MATTDQVVTRLETFIKENFPSSDIAPGSVLSELVVKAAASINTELISEIEGFAQQSSIKTIQALTVDTFSPAMDEIASNYGVVRNQGKKSSGQLKIFVASSRSYTVSAGVQFLQPGINAIYQTTAETRFSTSTASGDEQLFSQSGLFYFILPVEALEVGSSNQAQSGAVFGLVVSGSISDFVSAAAYGNFTTGLPIETDKELIARINTGLSNKGFLSPASITASLKDRYSGFQALSISGAGDAEMLRTKRNLFGISTFGMADVYIRSSIGLETKTFTKAATKLTLATDTVNATWSLSLGVDEYPGFYKILSIRPLTGSFLGSLLISSQTFSFLVPSEQRVNYINTTQDARFSVYQTCTAVFSYNESAPIIAVDDTQEFEVIVSRQPSLSEIQALFLDDTNRIACADYLVKAVVPCFVSLNIGLVKKNASDVIPVENIKRDIFNYINTIPFGENLYASRIVDICHNYPIKQVDLPIQMTGSIFAPNGSVITITDGDVLTISTDADIGVSKRTTMFFVDYTSEQQTDSIGIEII